MEKKTYIAPVTLSLTVKTCGMIATSITGIGNGTDLGLGVGGGTSESGIAAGNVKGSNDWDIWGSEDYEDEY